MADPITQIIQILANSAASTQWANDNAGFLMALLTAVYVTATIFIVRETRRGNELQLHYITQAEQFERARRRPHVVFWIEAELETFSSHSAEVFYHARVRNEGIASAHSIIVKTDPVIRARNDADKTITRSIRTPVMLKNPISVLVPNQVLSESVGPTKFLLEDNEDHELVFTVSISYENSIGEKYSSKYEIDLSQQKETLHPHDEAAHNNYRLLDQLSEGVKALKNISDTLDSPDRSNLVMRHVADVPSGRSNELLQELLDIVESHDREILFGVSATVTGTSIKSYSRTESQVPEVSASVGEVLFLCQLGALNGYYQHGQLWFTVHPEGRSLLDNRWRLS